MAHTHTFAMSINCIDAEGELTFPPNAAVKFNEGMDIPGREFHAISAFFHAINALYHECGENVTNIEIKKKP